MLRLNFSFCTRNIARVATSLPFEFVVKNISFLAVCVGLMSGFCRVMMKNDRKRFNA